MKIQEPSPPEVFLRFFRWFCDSTLRKYIEGDLFELYSERMTKAGKINADLCFILDVLLLFRPGIIRPDNFFEPTNNYAMIKSYFRIGWRNLVKNRGYSVINIGGLAMGMAVAILIGMWVYDELSFNRYHVDYDRVGQIMKSGVYEGNPYSGGFTVQYPLIDQLKTRYGLNFKYIAEATFPHEFILTAAETKISANGQFIGADVTKILSLEMIRGSRDCLKDPYSILLSASTATALFGDQDAMGQVVRVNTNIDVKVTGVYKDLPRNTTFHDIRFFVPFDLGVITNPWMKAQGWDNHFLRIYCTLADNTTFERVSENIVSAELNVIKGMENMQEQVAQQPRISVYPMSDWHLYSDFRWPNASMPDPGPLKFVILIATIGVFVLMLACINFMNLSTARSEKRAREVGIRKSMGSVRRQLIIQFFSESYLVVIFAFLLAIVFAVLALPLFNDLAAKQMAMPLTNAWFWIGSAVFIVITGLLSGSYPALYLSSFNPVKVLKGKLHAGKFTSVPRKVLVVLQFTVSVTLIICTIVVYSQIIFAKERPVGYTREGLIMIPKKSDDFHGKTAVLRNELRKTGVVDEISESGGAITNVWSGNGGFSWRDKDPNIDPQFGTLSVTHEYGRTVGWQFVMGRDFSDDLAGDSSAVVINESAAKVMGLENPVDEVIHWTNKNWNMDRDFRIAGVVRDMVMESPYEPAKPTIFLLRGWFSYFNIRISEGVSAGEALPKIESVFNKVIPTAPFDYKFVDEEYALKFVKEERIGKLASVFSALAIFISCMGLFGLSSFVAEQRSKELSIRKILGANVKQLWELLCRDFVVLVLVACCIAVPLSWSLMNDWLADFEYRTNMPWAMVAVVTLGSLGLTLLTVSFQAIKAALMNPVNNLRAE